MTALTMSVRTDIEVALGERMPVDAWSAVLPAACREAYPPTRIGGGGDYLEVIGIDAATITAAVVGDHTVWNRADQQLPGHPVDVVERAVDPDLAVAGR